MKVTFTKQVEYKHRKLMWMKNNSNLIEHQICWIILKYQIFKIKLEYWSWSHKIDLC